MEYERLTAEKLKAAYETMIEAPATPELMTIFEFVTVAAKAAYRRGLADGVRASETK